MFTYLVILLSCNFLKADVDLKLIGMQDHALPESNPCIATLDEFAQTASNFTMCSLHFARPIKLCENCIYQYTSFKEGYKKLTNSIINGTSCQSMYISHDRLDVVLSYYNNILAVWNKGNCNACFNLSKNPPELSSRIRKFNQLHDDTMECIYNNYNPVKNNSQEVCDTCKHFYINLDTYYHTLGSDSISIDEVCMDAVDSMNTTRSIWSKTLNCCKPRNSPEIIFLCCTAIISLLPLIFYLGVRYCGPIRDLPNVLKQSRFKQSLLRSTNGRIN